MFHHSINKGLAIACLLSIFSLTFIAQRSGRLSRHGGVSQSGRCAMSGPCPLKVVFNGYITTDGPGTVKYTFTRSDGAEDRPTQWSSREAGTQSGQH